MANTAVLELETIDNGLRFRVNAGSGQHTITDSGPGMVAPSPIEMLLIALGGCEAMDVISILRKKRLQVTGYQVRVTGERVEDHPKRFTHIVVAHRVRGVDLSEAAVAEAVRLSTERYCSVHASLLADIVIEQRIEVIDEAAPPPVPAPTPLPAPAKRRGLSELILRVQDVDRSLAFYVDRVGLTLERRDSPSWAWLWTGAPGALPRLGITSKPLSFGAAHTGGPAHFAIAVPRAAIAAEKARLESFGIAVEGPITFEFWRADSIYFSDPDDNRVELCGFEHLNPISRT